VLSQPGPIDDGELLGSYRLRALANPYVTARTLERPFTIERSSYFA
jgi:hypothetical protein